MWLAGNSKDLFVVRFAFRPVASCAHLVMLLDPSDEAQEVVRHQTSLMQISLN